MRFPGLVGYGSQQVGEDQCFAFDKEGMAIGGYATRPPKDAPIRLPFVLVAKHPNTGTTYEINSFHDLTFRANYAYKGIDEGLAGQIKALVWNFFVGFTTLPFAILFSWVSPKLYNISLVSLDCFSKAVTALLVTFFNAVRLPVRKLGEPIEVMGQKVPCPYADKMPTQALNSMKGFFPLALAGGCEKHVRLRVAVFAALCFLPLVLICTIMLPVAPFIISYLVLASTSKWLVVLSCAILLNIKVLRDGVVLTVGGLAGLPGGILPLVAMLANPDVVLNMMDPKELNQQT